MSSPPPARTSIALAALVLGLTSCFFDSRWIDAQRAKNARAQRATPSAIHATPEASSGDPSEAPDPAMRVLKLRVHATPRYAAEVTDWPKQVADLVNRANAILGPTANVRLEVVERERWTPSASDDDLVAILNELAAADPGADVDRVVCFVGSVPRYELSFHQLGLGRLPGKHFVVRAMNDAREYEAIERGLSDLGEEERRKIYHARKEHKTTSVFLHELAHTFGVPHEADARSIMSPSYDPKEDGFSPAAAEQMRASLTPALDPPPRAQNAPPSPPPSSSSSPPTRRKRGTWAAGAPPSVHAEPDLAALNATDRQTFDRATAELRAGHASDARTTAKPLYAAYPDVVAVQDLRCQIAMKLGMSWNDTQAECDRLMQLSPGMVGKAKDQ